jgi:hypothetical protein
MAEISVHYRTTGTVSERFAASYRRIIVATVMLGAFET